MKIKELEDEKLATLNITKNKLDEAELAVADLESALISHSQEISRLNAVLEGNEAQHFNLKNLYSGLVSEYSSYQETVAFRESQVAERNAISTLEMKRQIVELTRKEEKMARHKEQLKQTIIELKRDRDVVSQ